MKPRSASELESGKESTKVILSSRRYFAALKGKISLLSHEYGSPDKMPPKREIHTPAFIKFVTK